MRRSSGARSLNPTSATWKVCTPSDGVPRSVQGPGRGEGHSGHRAPERRDRPGDLRGDLRLGPAPLPRDDARHPRRHDLRPRVHRRGRGGRPVGAEPQARRPGDGAVQHLLRLVLLLRTRASTPTATTSTRTPPRSAASTATRTPAAATTAGRPSTCACRSPTSGPAVIPDWMDDEDAVLLTDALATGYFGAQLGDIVEGDTVVVFGAGPVGLFAAKSAWLMGAGRVIVIDHLDYRLEMARDVRPGRDHQLHRVRRHRRPHEEDHRLPRRRRLHRRGRRRGRRQLPAARHRRQAEAAGRLAGGAELGHRLGPQGRHRLGRGRLRPDLQRREVRRRDEQGPDPADEPVPGQAAVAAPVRAHPERLPQAQRHRHAPHPARADRRGLSHLLGEARRLHQAAHRSRTPH